MLHAEFYLESFSGALTSCRNQNQETQGWKTWKVSTT